MKNPRKCLACGKIHNGDTCPLIISKMNKYYNSSKQTYVMGNILLECIRKKTDFLQILLEIAEASVELDELANKGIVKRKSLYLDYITEYFAASLGCKSSLFYASSQKTSEIFSNMVELEFLDDISLYLDKEK